MDAIVDTIIASIWELPWYRVLYIAVVDDFIFTAKVWPFWIAVGVYAVGKILYYQWSCVWKPGIEAKKRNKDKKE